MSEYWRCVKTSCAREYSEQIPGSCLDCGSDLAPVKRQARKRVNNRVLKRPKTTIEIQEKTAIMLREYCQLHGEQIRSVIDGLIQLAIEQRLKERL